MLYRTHISFIKMMFSIWEVRAMKKSLYLFQHAVHHQRDAGALLRDTVHQVIVVPHVHLHLGLQLVWVNGRDAGSGGLLGGGGSRDCRLLFCKEIQ